jgi:hypothetical protein
MADLIEGIESRHLFKLHNNELYLSEIRIVKRGNPNFLFEMQQHRANGLHIV